MSRVAWALVLHELAERARDRWVVVTTVLFGLLSVGVTLYGGQDATTAAAVTAPSLVTLAAFLVPLVALILGHDAIVGERERHTLGLLLSLPVRRWQVLAAKYVGRALALLVAIGLGLGASMLALAPGARGAVLAILPQTILLGLAFLSFGVFISTNAWRHATAASLAVVSWFLLVLFWDLGLMALLSATDGALTQESMLWLVVANPAGLYRTGLLVDLVGADALSELGLAIALPSHAVQGALWALFILGPLALGALALSAPKAVSS